MGERPNWFVAFPIAAGPWLDAALAGAPAGLRRFHPADLHATAAFLGPCDAAAAARAFEAARVHPPPARVAHLGALVPMGPRGRPTAFSFELEEGDGALAAWVGAYRAEAWALAGARPDARPVRLHVTIARPTRRAVDATLRAAVAWARATPRAEVDVHVDALWLYTWAVDRRERLFARVDAITARG